MNYCFGPSSVDTAVYLSLWRDIPRVRFKQ